MLLQMMTAAGGGGRGQRSAEERKTDFKGNRDVFCDRGSKYNNTETYVGEKFCGSAESDLNLQHEHAKLADKNMD